MAQHHMKLSDVEATKNYPFRQKVDSFHQAYPSIDSIRVEVRPTGEGFEPYRHETGRVYVYNENSVPATIDCRNPRCFGGGLDLDHLIRWAVVESKRTEYEKTISCTGYEGSPKGRRNDGPCDTYFKVKVNVTYRGVQDGQQRNV